MAMEAHGVITGRQTHGVEADVDMMRGESGSSILTQISPRHTAILSRSTGGISADLDLSQRPAPSRSNIVAC